MVTNIKIAIGCDHAGFELKEAIANHLSNNNVEYIDCGAYDQQSVDYPDFAKKVVSELNEKNFTMGILVCGSGQGMVCLLYTSPSPRDATLSRMPSSA